MKKLFVGTTIFLAIIGIVLLIDMNVVTINIFKSNLKKYDNQQIAKISSKNKFGEIKNEFALQFDKDNKIAIKIIPILYYHSITDNMFGIPELHVSPATFDEQMQYLRKMILML